MTWGDILLGHEVTPESWVGGIVERLRGADPGRWGELRQILGEEGMCVEIEGWAPVFKAVHHKPIFPPKGWHGHSDEVLWEAVCGATIESGNLELGAGCFVEEDGLIWLGPFVDRLTMQFSMSPCELEGTILAMQNALVLSKRMGWV